MRCCAVCVVFKDNASAYCLFILFLLISFFKKLEVNSFVCLLILQLLRRGVWKGSVEWGRVFWFVTYFLQLCFNNGYGVLDVHFSQNYLQITLSDSIIITFRRDLWVIRFIWTDKSGQLLSNLAN